MQALRLLGLDSFSKKELDEFWSGYDPRQDEPRILGVNISTLNVCNLRCVYCYAGRHQPRPHSLTLDEHKSVITQARALGARTVTICGDGEPTMDGNLTDLVSHAGGHGMHSVIVTNGIIFGADETCLRTHGLRGAALLRFLHEHGASLVVKMDSLKEERYDTIVGREGTYGTFREAIHRMVEAGFNQTIQREDATVTRLSFSAVVMKSNVDELARLQRVARSLRAQFVCKLPSLVGNALDHIKEMFAVAEYERMRGAILGYTAKRETLMVDTPRCMAWHYGPTLDCEGEIRECYTSPCPAGHRIGNIREHSLSDLLRKRNRQYDITTADFCPVKARINRELEENGLGRLWKAEEGERRDSTSGGVHVLRS